jgi:predicted signal transduction protein with EAL and GGDEF domain
MDLAQTKGQRMQALALTTLEQHLRNAITQEHMTLQFQPIHSSQGDLIGFEALCRWTDDDLGVIAPDQFIPLAERLSLMESLGAWVLTEACRQGAWLQSETQEILISVNVSPSQLLQADFVELVHRALTAAGLPAGALRLEISEHTLIDMETCLAHLYDLRALGVQIAMDDFGQLELCQDGRLATACRQARPSIRSGHPSGTTKPGIARGDCAVGASAWLSGDCQRGRNASGTANA